MANNLCQMFGKPPLYEINDEPASVFVGQLNGDEYYGRPLATVVTNILETRKIRGVGPAAVRDVYDQMKLEGISSKQKTMIMLCGVCVLQWQKILNSISYPVGNGG